MPPATTTSCGRPESSFCQFLALGNSSGRTISHACPAPIGEALGAGAREAGIRGPRDQEGVTAGRRPEDVYRSEAVLRVARTVLPPSAKTRSNGNSVGGEWQPDVDLERT